MLAFKRYLEVQNETDIKIAISSRGVINFESEKELKIDEELRNKAIESLRDVQVY